MTKLKVTSINAGKIGTKNFRYNPNNSPNWFQNVKITEGLFGEYVFLKKLINEGHNIITWNGLSKVKKSDWDIHAEKDGIETYYEVKTNTYEFVSKRPWDVLVEFESDGVPSGLSTTKADKYILYYPFEDIYYEIGVDEIKGLIENNTFETKYGGNNYLSHMYKISRDLFGEKNPLRFMDYMNDKSMVKLLQAQEWHNWYNLKFIQKVI